MVVVVVVLDELALGVPAIVMQSGGHLHMLNIARGIPRSAAAAARVQGILVMGRRRNGMAAVGGGRRRALDISLA
jgi:hypothetical protein